MCRELADACRYPSDPWTNLQFEDIDAAASTHHRFAVIMCATVDLETLIMTRFIFLVLERPRVVAPTSARPLAASVPAL
jgi:hypothetical protein